MGSVLSLLLYRCLRGSPEDNIGRVWDFISTFYSDNRVQNNFPHWAWHPLPHPTAQTPTTLGLRGKGVEIKDIVCAVVSLWESSRSHEYELVKDMLFHQQAMIGILSFNADSLFLPCDQAPSFIEHNDTVLELYTSLARRADTAEDLPWKLVHKHHWQWDLPQKVHWHNLRVNGCMIDADFVGRFKLVVGACVHGTPTEYVPMSVKNQKSAMRPKKNR